MTKRIPAIILTAALCLSLSCCAVSDNSKTASGEIENAESYWFPDESEPLDTGESVPVYTEDAADTGMAVAYPTPGTTGGITLPEAIPQSMLDSLVNLLDSSNYACAIYYCDLTTGLTLTYNDTRVFASASLIKAPYLYYVLDMVQKGELSLDELHTYQAKYHKYGGTGTIKTLPDGSKVTLKEIIEHICYESDNTAFKMLYNTSGTSGGVLSLSQFHSIAKREYGSPFVSGSNIVCTARGVGRIFKEIYKRSLTSDLYAWYVDLLKEANVNVFVKGGLPTDENGESLYVVAHKYGMDCRASNDAGIVFYKDRPYLLVILTDFLNEGSNVTFMNKISTQVFNIHEYIAAANNAD